MTTELDLQAPKRGSVLSMVGNAFLAAPVILLFSTLPAGANDTIDRGTKPAAGNKKQQHDPCGNAKVKVQIADDNKPLRPPGNYIWVDPSRSWTTTTWPGGKPRYFTWPQSNWTFNAFVSDHSGLEVGDVVLNSRWTDSTGAAVIKHRYMAELIKLKNYSYLPLGSKSPVVKNLDRSQCTGMRVDFPIGVDPKVKIWDPRTNATNQFHVQASYIDSDICLSMEQDFVFEGVYPDKELSLRFNAARVRPKLRFMYVPKGTFEFVSDFTFRTDCAFRPSGNRQKGTVGKAELISDVQFPSDFLYGQGARRDPLNALIYQSVDLGRAWYPGVKSMENKTGPFWTAAINSDTPILAAPGRIPRTPGNLHFSPNPGIFSWPTMTGVPGCPECVHSHWNWTQLYDVTDNDIAEYIKNSEYGFAVARILREAPPVFHKHPVMTDEFDRRDDSYQAGKPLQDIMVGSDDRGNTFSYITKSNPRNITSRTFGDVSYAEGIFFAPRGDASDVLPTAYLF